MTTDSSDGASASPGDAEALRRLHRFGGKGLVEQMVALFVEHGPPRIAAARAALASGDLATAQRMTHMMKSSAGQLGAEPLQRLSAEAESLCEKKQAARVGPILDRMDAEFERWRRWVETLDLDRPAGG